VKLLVDMNLSPSWVTWLIESGFDASHWSALGKPDAPDSELMAYARALGYVVLTHDLDFSAILAATGGEKPSVVQIRADNVRPEAIGAMVVSALHQMETEIEAGALITVEVDRTRIRVLPLLRRSTRSI